MNHVHVTVLLHEAVSGLSPKKDGVYVDATLGAGGHSKAICDAAPGCTIIGIDADKDAVVRATTRLKSIPCTLKTSIAYNDHIDEVLDEHGFTMIDGVLLDLGMSSDQLETSGRGFSFKRDEPLLMTMDSDRTHGLTAEKIVNTFTLEQIRTILIGYGEERYAHRIAKAVVEAREAAPIITTSQLADIIISAVPVLYRKGKVHPATKTFQALRIAVNDEIERLELVLEKAFARLQPQGRLSVISFHSIEDRIVKQFMRAKADAGIAKRITKKPIVPTEDEILINPRARSSKLRILEKL